MFKEYFSDCCVISICYILNTMFLQYLNMYGFSLYFFINRSTVSCLYTNKEHASANKTNTS